MFLFQFTADVSTSFLSASSSPSIFFNVLLFIFLLGLIIAASLFIIRAFWQTQSRTSKAFRLTVLQILVPKERKSESTKEGIGEDRLEKIREEIGITETFFSTIAGLRAQKGILHWLRGRNDHFGFEIVMHNGLISFYIAVPEKLRGFIEQQLHAQYPYAQIEEMIDYNIFTEKSN